ncbi:TPA: ead/Ea22-like family protein, partial [Klebsiella michiganensis]
MTDITELAQRMKAAAEKATPGQWERGDGKHGGELLVYCDDALGSAVCEATSEYNAIPKYQRIDNLDFIAMASPANVLALVEALEKAQRANAAQDDHINQQQDRIESLEKKNAELGKYAGELESRTVKMPVAYTASSGHPFNEAERTVMIPGGGDWLNRFDVEHVLT